MARQTTSYLSIVFLSMSLAATGCGGGPEDLTNDFLPVVQDSGAPGTPGTGGTGATGGGAAAGGGVTGTAGGVSGTAGGVTGTAGGTAGSGGLLAGGILSGTGGLVAGAGGATGSGGTTGPGGVAGGDAGTSDAGSTGGSSDGGVISDAGSATSDAAVKGECCPDGNCLCHGTVPTKLGAQKGPFKTATLQLSTGVAHYPTDAQPPFAGISICPGFLNFGPEMADWGVFYASWGIVTLVTDTIPTDVPEIRADKLLASIKALKAENMKSGSPLNGKMAGRYGTSGYSMGGGGTTMASVTDPSLLSSVGLAAWEPVGRGIKVPTLLFCGTADVVAGCGYADGSYSDIPNTTPKMKIVISGAEHLGSWFGPADGGNGTSGGYALAFQKVYLEGDLRWKTLLLAKPGGGHTLTTNIMP
jgi:hypothetical protein